MSNNNRLPKVLLVVPCKTNFGPIPWVECNALKPNQVEYIEKVRCCLTGNIYPEIFLRATLGIWSIEKCVEESIAFALDKIDCLLEAYERVPVAPEIVIQLGVEKDSPGGYGGC